MGSLGFFETVLGEYGLMIPPFSNIGVLQQLTALLRGPLPVSDDAIATILQEVYTPANLATMVVSRYPCTPVVCEYKVTISEAIEAHFLGLDHVAVAGLMPTIEGIGRKLCATQGLSSNGYLKTCFTALVTRAIELTNQTKAGDYQQVESMLQAFLHFLLKYFYEESSSYPLSDKTNRHGVTHGAYADADYGHPLNFYKTLSALDMLCLISQFRPIPPRDSDESRALALYYIALRRLQGNLRASCLKAVKGALNPAE